MHFQRHDLHRRVAHFVQEAVDDRPAQQNVPTRTRRLAEDDVSDALAPGEIDQRVGDVGALQFYYFRAEFLGETQALRERDEILRVDAAWLFARRFDVNGVPIRSQPPGDARSDAQQLLGATARGYADHHFFGDDGLPQAFALAVILRLRGLVFGHLAQRQLAQRRKIAFAEEIGQRLLDLFNPIDFALTQSGAQRVYRDVDVNHLVGATQEAVGNRLPHLDAGDARHHVVERFDVLDVDGRDDRNARVEQFYNVFVSLVMFRAGDVRMRQLINDGYLGPAGDDRVDVHFPERDPAVLDLAHGRAFQVADQRFGLGAPVRLHERHDYVYALLLELMGVFEHLV